MVSFLTKFKQKIKYFFKLIKNTRKDQEIVSSSEREIYENLQEEHKKIIQKREKEKPIKKINEEKPQFQKLLEDLETNRWEIIKQKEYDFPKIERGKDCIKCKLKGITFLLDEKGYNFFNEKFIISSYGKVTIKDNYLALKQDNSFSYFHRWFMQEEVKDFCAKNDCDPKEVHVHHIDLTKTNNKKENLKVMFIEDHKKLHHRERFNGSDEKFEEWYEDNIFLRLNQKPLDSYF